MNSIWISAASSSISRSSHSYISFSLRIKVLHYEILNAFLNINHSGRFLFVFRNPDYVNHLFIGICNLMWISIDQKDPIWDQVQGISESFIYLYKSEIRVLRLSNRIIRCSLETYNNILIFDTLYVWLIYFAAMLLKP